MDEPHEAMGVIIAITTSIVVALVSAYFEHREQARRIAANDTRKLDHNLLTIARALVIGPVAIYIGGGVTWSAVLWGLVIALVFTPVHRTAKNLLDGQKFHYMGPSIRGTGDSWYDGIWWSMTADTAIYFVQHDDTLTTHYYVRRDWYPWLVCTVFETCLLFGDYMLIQTTAS